MRKGSNGKMTSVYNSVHEIKIRILLLLRCSIREFISSDMIAGLDFITVYGKEFGVSDFNLHGDNRYKFSELPSRREVVQRSLNYLVRNNLVEVSLANGFEYQIADRGEEFIEGFQSEYAAKYTQIAEKTFEKYGNSDETELFKMIQSKSSIPTIYKEDE